MMIRFQRARSFSSAGVLALSLSVLLFVSCATTATQTPGSGSPASGQHKAGTRQLDPAQAQRIQKIMPPLIQAMNKPIPLNQVTLTILEEPDINAANAGGGKFYITTGLLEKANDDQMRGVLAHEIAHADLGHVAKAQTVGAGLNVGMIILDQIIPGSGMITPLIADLGVMKPFSRSEEYQADAHGVEILNKAGYNGKQIMAGTLSWLLQTSGPSGGFFATHPGTQDRIQRIQAMP
jgi:Zn-dependent protease with chaperone function